MHSSTYLNSLCGSAFLAKRTPNPPIRLPPTLKKLTIDVSGSAPRVGGRGPNDAVLRGTQQLLINTAALVSTLTYLKLSLVFRGVKLDCTPLANLINLEDLWLVLPLSAAAEAMSTVKQLPMLESMRVQTCYVEERPRERASILRSLCSSPLPRKLAKLGMDGVVTADPIPALAQLPSLTVLDAHIDAAAAPHLPLLTQLNTLKFFSHYNHSHYSSTPFLPFISPLPQLTDLTLSQCSLSDEQAARIMAGCKHLTSMQLRWVRLESLNWLVTQHSSVNLLSLQLRMCEGIDASRTTPILSLKSLQHLTLRATCRLDGFARQTLTPPTTLLPNLTSFDYGEPIGWTH